MRKLTVDDIVDHRAYEREHKRCGRVVPLFISLGRPSAKKDADVAPRNSREAFVILVLCIGNQKNPMPFEFGLAVHPLGVSLLLYCVGVLSGFRFYFNNNQRVARKSDD